MSGPWTDAEIKLLGTMPDFELGRLLGRPGKAVWAKRRLLGIAAPPPQVRPWTPAEDDIVRAHSVSDAARMLQRTEVAVRIRRRKLGLAVGRHPQPQLLSLDEAKQRIEVPKYDSKEQEERVRFVGGPYAPPLVPIGGTLKCELRGDLRVAGYSNALIPWPVAASNNPKQLIVCGDLIRALRTESVAAVKFHFGVSRSLIWEYRQQLGIERLNPGSLRLFWRTVDHARSEEARAKMSQSREGRKDTMTPEAREQLREIQKRPKTEAWKERMAERLQRRYRFSGRPRPWTEEELSLIGTRPDREVAKLLNRSLSAVKGKKFQLLRQTRQNSREKI
jgi:hypothetical protein